MLRTLMMTLVGLCCVGTAMAADSDFTAAALEWDPSVGVQVRARAATVKWDQNDQLAAPVLTFAAGGELSLRNPRVAQLSDKQLNLAYEVTTPDGTTLQVTRELTLTCRDGETELVEAFRLTPAKPLTTDLEIRRPLTIRGAKVSTAASAVCPLFNGWAKPYPLSEQPLEVDYRLGNVLRGQEQLALPVIQLDSQDAWRATLSADCRSALCSASPRSKTRPYRGRSGIAMLAEKCP